MANVQEKGRRLLAEGRLTVTYVGADRLAVTAACRGDSGKVYSLGFDRNGWQWRCNCEARGECSHLIALKLVTLEPTL